MKKGLIALVIIVLLVLWIGSTFIGHRNEMVRSAKLLTPPGRRLTWCCNATPT